MPGDCYAGGCGDCKCNLHIIVSGSTTVDVHASIYMSSGRLATLNVFCSELSGDGVLLPSLVVMNSYQIAYGLSMRESVVVDTWPDTWRSILQKVRLLAVAGGCIGIQPRGCSKLG